MQVPPNFYKSTNIVLYENHKGICSGQMVPTPKIYGIGSAPKYSRQNLKQNVIELNQISIYQLLDVVQRTIDYLSKGDAEMILTDVLESVLCALGTRNVVSDEFHYLFECDFFNDTRLIIPPAFMPTGI